MTADPRFGEVSGLDRDEMLQDLRRARGRPRSCRASVIRWTACSGCSNVRASLRWDSPFGRGRPGWHIECAAIAHDNLGNDFDIQGGGSDLVFPHHEMSAGEAQVAFPGHDFAKAYAHGGMVGYQGSKMSKSLGNLVLVSALRTSGVDPRAIRLTLLSHHYRTDWEWFDDGLSTGSGAAEGLAGRRTQRWTGRRATVREVLARMADDLDAPGALAAIDAWAESSDSRVAVPAISSPPWSSPPWASPGGPAPGLTLHFQGVDLAVSVANLHDLWKPSGTAGSTP